MSARCHKCGRLIGLHLYGECVGPEPPSSLAAPSGSPAHVHFEITTGEGNRAIIKGDPNMSEATRKALATMIDAVVKAANAGELKAPGNSGLEQPNLLP